jgi:hypothetical protein
LKIKTNYNPNSLYLTNAAIPNISKIACAVDFFLVLLNDQKTINRYSYTNPPQLQESIDFGDATGHKVTEISCGYYSSIVLLENVQNIVGPRHIHEWNVIVKTLRDLGYRISENPMVVSPHLIRRDFGGRPQVRNRVFIAATLIPKNIPNNNESRYVFYFSSSIPFFNLYKAI